ncbi:acylphosphatase [Staphylococcus condimenti]|uniref:acylphosphatase n=1 Tax=Staphylococcus condimenti TaxID=70255 RepID=A0A143P8F9_9STAP|nr:MULTISPECIES: acylphosphatase [Staphylococcus]AMY04805.1 acylphosphatase [Staphylococcus condimenti]APR61047.1 acylphosphatase [Staphylococcus condimenti]MDK8644076.1 acylphosphatase [Staphylococcus condimenti]OFP01395.1 acylphosphatase [Staphylococcus sp. HMSC065E08]PNZ57534.1 acylphosphatase [Staphylococcus condimenti]
MQHRKIQVFGQVQGVGFRYFTERLAQKYNIVGTVQNVEQYVEIFAQGEENELEQFTQAVIEGASPASKVTDYKIEQLDIDSSLKRFRTI